MGVNVNGHRDEGNTALHWAAARATMNGDPTVVEMLLAAGADTTIVNDNGHSPTYNVSDEIKNVFDKHNAKPGRAVGGNNKYFSVIKGGKRTIKHRSKKNKKKSTKKRQSTRKTRNRRHKH